MFRNYLKVAWRNLLKSKVFSLINITGLTIGITVCMMIFLFIMNEFSVDKFHRNKDHMYRVMRSFDPSKPSTPYLSGPYATALMNDFGGEIQKVVRVMPTNGLISIGNIAFNEKKLYLADSNFFSFFTFPLLKGDAATALRDPLSIVMTETTAKKYFGNEDPIGKVVELDKHRRLTVTGIAKDAPVYSHLSFDMVVPMSNYYNDDWFKGWLNNNGFVYALLNPNTDQKQLEKKFPAFMDKYMGKEMDIIGARFNLSLVPLKEIYFESASSFDNVKHGDKSIVYIFLSIAVLILLIACINFTNLSTIRAVERSKEVGLRKVLGALRNHLISQFIGESVLLTFVSCVLSIGLLQLLMPWYNQLLGYTLEVSWTSWIIYSFLAGVIIIVGLLAGSYPAFFLSSFSPIQALKGKLRLGKGGSFFRQALVVVQFSISVFLIIGTIIIMNQMDYVKNKQLGYEKEQTILVPLDNGNIYDNRNAFKNELLRDRHFSAVTLASGQPGGFFDSHTFEAEGQTQIWKSRTLFADFEYVNTLGLKIIAGRNFSGEYATDTTDAAIINRTAAAQLGFTADQAIGKWVKNTVRDAGRRRVIGVVEDFNFLSLKEKMDALVISPSDDRRIAIIKIAPGDLKGALAVAKNTYAKLAPVYPFEYTFLDQQFDEMYRTDIRQQSILSIFSGLAIFIACLGLFGLASFTAVKRTKEIGVRKVLGSTTENIVMLLAKDLLRPVCIAILIAVPFGYYAMSNWLQNFAYQTPLHWWIFLLSALITLGIAFFTVGFRAMKAALANPVKSLRTE